MRRNMELSNSSVAEYKNFQAQQYEELFQSRFGSPDVFLGQIMLTDCQSRLSQSTCVDRAAEQIFSFITIQCHIIITIFCFEL